MATHNLPACKFSDAGDLVWDGFDEGGEWNGWSNVAVTPATWELMLAKWTEEAKALGHDTGWVDELRVERTVGSNGLVSLGWGLCMSINKENE